MNNNRKKKHHPQVLKEISPKNCQLVMSKYHRYKVTHKIMYTAINFFFLGLFCSGKKVTNLEKFIRVEQASEHKKINFAQCKIKNF